jgi:nitroreductase/subtilisin-like proprotein convertase family protein
MRNGTLYFAIFILISCLGSMVTVQLKETKAALMSSAVSSKISELNQNNSVAVIYIEHTCRGDLIVDLGVGDPDKPDWSINIWNKEGGDAENLNLTIDISDAVQYLPPSESGRWFLKVYDAENENQGQITEFTVTYNGQTYASTCIPVSVHDLQTSFSYIPGVPLELAISRRMSIRDFPDIENYALPEVSWELLSKVLWAGYGYSSWGRTVPNICGNYPLTIYVCNKTAAYKYDPQTESLDLWKEGDYRFFGIDGQAPAPVELFIVMDMNKSSDTRLGWEEAGCIVQNIYLQANALGLGTVCTSGYDEEVVHEALELPTNEFVLYNMPLGHPETSAFYNLTCVDPPLYNLPQVKQSSVFLEYALTERQSSHDWSETSLTPQETSQILWSAYGVSYLRDLTKNRRHRVVPSAHGRYPFYIRMANATGVYHYDPWKHRTLLRIEGDKRAELAEVAGEDWIASAPTMLVLVWNSSKEERQDYAYTEVGLILQNVHLESVACGLVADWADVTDEDAMRSLLGLGEQTDLRPVTVIAVGHPSTYQHKVLWNRLDYTVSVSTNSTVTNFAFDQPAKTESFEIAGTNGTTGFCNVTIPIELLNGDFSLWIDDSPVSFTITHNSTHSSLHFNYTHTVHKVRIAGTTVIPERIHLLPVAIIFILATAIVIHRHTRRRKNFPHSKNISNV